MHARERVNAPFVDRNAGAGLTLPALPAGNRPAGAAATAGPAAGPARACLFCRYRRTEGQAREAVNA